MMIRDEYKMTPEEFSQYIRKNRSVLEVIYLSNKDLFDEAEREGLIKMRIYKWQITVAETIHPPTKTYSWRWLGDKSD